MRAVTTSFEAGDDQEVSGQTISPDRPALRTRAVLAGGAPTAGSRPLTQPIFQTSAYAFTDSTQADNHFAAGEAVYARDGLPNVRTLERLVADLEGADDAVAVASGMAAISLTVFALLAAGDHIVAPDGCYRDTTALLTEQFARFGIRASFVDTNDLATLRAAITPTTRLVLVETISNPGMVLADLPGIAGVVHETDAVLCVDNTFATPALCRPIEHSADLVVHSAGKFLGGHHDLTAGVVAGRRSLVDRIRRGAYLLGPTLAPMDAWLAVRGLQTLAPRMIWISQTAATVASFLARHPGIACLRYPGCPGVGREVLTERLLPAGAGGLMAFDLRGGPAAADRFIRDLRMIPYAPTVGGTSTIVSYPPQSEPLDDAGLPRPRPYRSATVRLSIGLEDPHDVIADLKQALDCLEPPLAADLRETRGWEA